MNNTLPGFKAEVTTKSENRNRGDSPLVSGQTQLVASSVFQWCVVGGCYELSAAVLQTHRLPSTEQAPVWDRTTQVHDPVPGWQGWHYALHLRQETPQTLQGNSNALNESKQSNI